MEWGAILNAYVGESGCGFSVVDVGPVDAQWGPWYSPFDFNTYLINYRKLASYSFCRKTYYSVDKSYGPPLRYDAVQTYVYGNRSPSCADGWLPQDDVPTKFCYQPQPIDDKTCPAGNPVSLGTGAKLHTESDYIGSGADPFTFARIYRSRWPYGAGTTSAGLSWFHNFDLRILKLRFDATHAVLRVMRPDNSVAVFALDPASSATAPVWLSKTTKDQITQTGPTEAAIGYTYKVFETDATNTARNSSRWRWLARLGPRLDVRYTRQHSEADAAGALRTAVRRRSRCRWRTMRGCMEDARQKHRRVPGVHPARR